MSKRVLLGQYGAVNFFLFSAIAALYPFFPLLLQEKGFSESQVGFLLGSYEVFSIAGLLIIGHIYDRFRSPRRTISFLNITNMIILLLIVLFSGQYTLILLTLILGFFIKSVPSLVDAHFGQSMPGDPGAYGKVRLFGSLGFSICAFIIHITAVVRASTPRTIFWGYSICLAIATIMVLTLPKAGHHSASQEKSVSFKEAVKSFPKVYWLGLVIVFLNYVGLSGHYTFFSLLIRNKFAVEDIGALWAVGPILEIPLFFFSAWFMKKLGLKGLWLLSLGAGVLRMQVYSLADSLLPLYLIQICHSITFGFNHFPMVTLINKITEPRTRGIAMGIFSAVGMGMALFIGGFLGGVLLELSGYTLLFQVFSLFPLLGIGITVFFLKGKETNPANSPLRTSEKS